MKKIAVFGANGFLGRHLVAGLSVSGKKQCKILAFDRFSSFKTSSDSPFKDLYNVETVVGDFFNRDDVEKTLVGCDYAFHLVSTTNPATSNEDPLIDIETNIRSSVEFFEQCVTASIKKVIFFSSGGTVYGDTGSSLISENMLVRPQSPYGIAKLAIENYLRYFKSRHGLDYIVYRIANPYGPGQNIHGKQGVVPIFLHKILQSEPITVFGDGTMVRDYLYIDDLIQMILGSYASNNQYDEYNIGSGGNGNSVNELLEAIEACTSVTIKRTTVPVPETFVEKSVLDMTRFVSEFKISPETDLREGIAKTWNYVQNIK